MNTYVLGILWALGSYEEFESNKTNNFMVRHSRPYFPQVVQQELAPQAKVRLILHDGKPQYRINIYDIDMVTFIA